MAWFSFGKRKQNNDEQQDTHSEEYDNNEQGNFDSDRKETVQQDNVQKLQVYQGRGNTVGPWDVDDQDVPNYDEYLSLGSLYLPFLEGIGLQLKANQEEQTVLAAIINFGKSSLELEAFAAPKTLGLWDDVRRDLLNVQSQAYEQEGVFGMELMLPVQLKSGKTVTTRMVGVDGPRWMLRGIFSGPASSGEGTEYEELNKYFASIVVDRGHEPLAPRDLIPMTPPVPPSERKLAQEAEDNATLQNADLKRSNGPLNSDQQTQVKTTLSRGPMFSELR